MTEKICDAPNASSNCPTLKLVQVAHHLEATFCGVPELRHHPALIWNRICPPEGANVSQETQPNAQTIDQSDEGSRKRHTFRRKTSKCVFGDIKDRPRAGLLHLVAFIAETNDLPVHLERGSPMPHLPPPVRNAQTEADFHVSEFIVKHERGTIEVGTNVNISLLLRQIVLSFPTNTFAIITPNSKKAVDIRVQLTQTGVNVEERVHLGDDEIRRIEIGAPELFIRPVSEDEPIVGYESRHVVILSPGANWTKEDHQAMFLNVDSRFRLYAIVPNQTSLPPSERDFCVGLLGHAKINILFHGAEQRPGRILWCDPRNLSCRSKIMGDCPYRSFIWTNRHRNRVVADLARRIDGSMPTDAFPRRRIVVLTASVEHANALARELQGWSVMTSNGRLKIDVTWTEDLWCNYYRNGPSANVIATIAGLNTLVSEPSIIIWAGGGPSIPDIAVRHFCIPQQTAASTTEPVILFDFQDRIKPLRKWAAKRREKYTDLGWMLPGDSIELGAIKNYITIKEREAHERR